MSETAMQTHMFTAHVDNEICCMFCDLRGVSADEMTIHINSVHCSDHSNDDSASHNGLFQHTKSEQPGTKSQSNSMQTTQFLVTSMHCDHKLSMHSVDSDTARSQTFKSDASSLSFNSNIQTDNQRELSRESPGDMCKINRSKQQKRKLSSTSVGSNGSCGQETTNSLPVCANSSNDADVTTNCCTLLHSSSASQSLPETTVADGMHHGDRFAEYTCPYCTLILLLQITRSCQKQTK